MWSASRSARPDSLSPQVRKVRERITAGCLVGHPRHRVDDLVADRADQARRGPRLRVGDGGRALRHQRLAQVVGGHAPAPRHEHLQDAVGDVVVLHETDVHDLGDRLPGDVVLGRAEAAAHHHRIRPGQRQLQRLDDAAQVVAHGLGVGAVDAGDGEGLAEPRRVGVDDLPEQQLRTDGDDLTTHLPTPGSLETSN
jgi:hypothetical protein